MNNNYFLLAALTLCSVSYTSTIAKKHKNKRKYEKKYLPGFRSLYHESDFTNLEVEGSIPEWLQGNLFLAGPGTFQAGKERVNHVFDGLAMIHRFSFNEGIAGYKNKFLGSKAYKKTQKRKKMSYVSFATEPKRSLFSKLFSLLIHDPVDNAALNVMKYDDEYVALTQIPTAVALGPDTLHAQGNRPFKDSIWGQMTGGTPHIDPDTGEIINFLVFFGPLMNYKLCSFDPYKGLKRKLIATIPIKNACHMFAFGLTKNYAVLIHTPNTVNFLTLIFRTKPFAKNLKWNPKKGTTFYVINRHTKKVVKKLKGPAFFFIHSVNAYEEGDNIHIDLPALPDPSVIDAFYLKTLYNPYHETIFPCSQLKRFTIDMKNDTIKSKRLCEKSLERPCINYHHYNTKDYTYAYGVHSKTHKDLGTCLIKANVKDGSYTIWEEEGCYPNEPVFVPKGTTPGRPEFVAKPNIIDSEDSNIKLINKSARPAVPAIARQSDGREPACPPKLILSNAEGIVSKEREGRVEGSKTDLQTEDDGVLLSHVLDSKTNTSFLLILDAKEFT